MFFANEQRSGCKDFQLLFALERDAEQQEEEKEKEKKKKICQ